MLMRSFFAVLTVFMVCLSAVRADVLVFDDHFNNGNELTNSYSPPNYWAKRTNNATITEPAGTNVSFSYTSTFIYNALNGQVVSPDFNFFDHEITVTVKNVNVTGTTSDAARVIVTVGSTNAGTDSPDRYRLEVGYNATNSRWSFIQNSLKVDNTGYIPVPAPAGGFVAGTTLSRLDLTLNSTGYSFTLTTDLNNTMTKSGTWAAVTANMTEANWGTGSSALSLGVQSGGGTGGATTTVDELLVTVIPEPATLGLLGIGGLMMFSHRRR